MIFHQLFDTESSTYTYILGDSASRECVIIDSVLECVERDLKLISENQLKLRYVIETHVHADHITGAAVIRNRTGAKTCVSCHAKVEGADILLKDGDEVVFGSQRLKVLETPGHTDSCLSFYAPGMVFTGDALLIKKTGRTDFQQGSAEKLYDSITKKLFVLPDETVVYPAHDYEGVLSTTIGAEKKTNLRIGNNKTKGEFVEIMNNLKLDKPRRINEAVPANLLGGVLKK